MAKSFNFQSAPGFLIRRSHQIAVSVFMETTAGFDITPVQFAILNALIDAPGTDQVTLAASVAFDSATSGSVIGRLESKGWVRREADAGDKRRKLLWITPEGERLAREMRHAVTQVHTRIMSPLDASEQLQLAALLQKLVAGYEAQGDA